VTQCISNLLDNAVKFVDSGTVPRVRISAERERECTRICIADNGIGIEPEAQQRLFALFERVATSGMYHGTGLGLAIVRKAAERMNGQVGVRSSPGQGSTFWLELPAVA
jgi:signal transduction histidine kinase